MPLEIISSNPNFCQMKRLSDMSEFTSQNLLRRFSRRDPSYLYDVLALITGQVVARSPLHLGTEEIIKNTPKRHITVKMSSKACSW